MAQDTKRKRQKDDGKGPSTSSRCKRSNNRGLKTEITLSHEYSSYSTRTRNNRIKTEEDTEANINSTNNTQHGIIVPDRVKSEETSHCDPDAFSSKAVAVTIPFQKIKSENKHSKPLEVTVKSLLTSTSPSSPSFQTIRRPTTNECEYVTHSLSLLHPHVISKNDERRKTLLESCGMRDNITDAIISTMLSQNTTDANTKAAYKKLKESFASWDDVASCHDISSIENCIRVAGLAKTRAERIQTMLRIVKEERGEASLDYIKDIRDDEEVKKELSRFKGLGPKTISCVLLFALGRAEFPVDTHVLRITKQMGWVSAKDTRESAYEHLNRFVPDHLKLDLHCLLVQHGKVCHRCASRNKPQFPPKDGSKLKCPLIQIPLWGGSVQSQKTTCKTEL